MINLNINHSGVINIKEKMMENYKHIYSLTTRLDMYAYINTHKIMHIQATTKHKAGLLL